MKPYYRLMHELTHFTDSTTSMFYHKNQFAIVNNAEALWHHIFKRWHHCSRYCWMPPPPTSPWPCGPGGGHHTGGTNSSIILHPCWSSGGVFWSLWLLWFSCQSNFSLTTMLALLQSVRWLGLAHMIHDGRLVSLGLDCFLFSPVFTLCPLLCCQCDPCGLST